MLRDTSFTLLTMNIKTWDNKTISLELPANFESKNLLALPALIDCHVHFRVPGGEHKEDWRTGAQAAIHGGVTTVLDMPNNTPSVTTLKLVEQKKQLIDTQLNEVGIPLHYGLYIGATKDNLAEIEKAKDHIIGIKMFMGSSTGTLLVDKKEDQEAIFALATRLQLPLAVHAEDEAMIQKNKSIHEGNDSLKVHGFIRNPEVAKTAVAQAIELAEKYQTKLYILHVSTQGEVELVREAKTRGVKVFAETTPHHLFLDSEAYHTLGSKAQMNPPLRTPEDQEALWEGINDGTIDTIGTDHAPHTLEEKSKSYPDSPSGVPGIETALPLLLDAYSRGKLSLDGLIAITSTNAQNIFNLPKTDDLVIVDLDLQKEVRNENLKTKCGWSPFAGWTLKGWPVATILSEKMYVL